MTANHTTAAAGPVDLGQAQKLCAIVPERLERLRLMEGWAREDADSYLDPDEHAKVVAALRAGADALDMLPRLVAGAWVARELAGELRRNGHDRGEGGCSTCHLVAAHERVIQGGGGS